MLSATRTAPSDSSSSLANVPRQLLAGLLLVGIAWPTAWFGPLALAEFTFFPLWLGYVLTVDGLVERRTGTSLLRRSSRHFLALFLVSIPLWWLYEAINDRLGNWEYLYPRDIGFLHRHAHASVAFSTVVPALFETAELYRSTRLLRRLGRWIRIAPSRRGLLGFSAFGLVLIALTVAFPRQAFPLVWLGLFFIFDPIVNLLGGRSISAQVARGRWDTVVALFLAGITCGLFWETWNYWSMPKWVYHIPYVSQPKLFEMPILGYGGYLPFALEVYAAVQAVNLLIRIIPTSYLQFDDVEP
ncbi:MAG: hypothetical protein QOF33_2094 [Thermomicrobiales bacterium]|nr:hypothetical protein [Thermomicrobiales bacterium]